MQCGFLISECKIVSEANPDSKRKTAVGRSFRVLGSVMMQCSFLISECKTVSEANPNSAKERDCCWNEL